MYWAYRIKYGFRLLLNSFKRQGFPGAGSFHGIVYTKDAKIIDGKDQHLKNLLAEQLNGKLKKSVFLG